MPKTEWESRKADQRTAKNADQAEFLALRSGTCPVDEGVRDDRMADAMDDFGAGEQNVARWASDDSKQDDAVGAVASEIERRSLLMGGSYPFIKSGNKLTYRVSQTLAYELCLAVSNAPSLNAGEYAALPPAFERLCRDVVKCFLGQGSDALRTGWPVDGEAWRTAKFKSVVDKLNSVTSEWVWHPGKGMPQDPSHQDIKDLGIDFAVWKRITDGRKGMMFLLGQCACGDDWGDKFDDLDLCECDGWFRHLSVVTPVRLFCIPYHIPNSTYFEEVNRRAGLTLDRARIVMLAEDAAHQSAVVGGSIRPLRELIDVVVNGMSTVSGNKLQAKGGRRRKRTKE